MHLHHLKLGGGYLGGWVFIIWYNWHTTYANIDRSSNPFPFMELISQQGKTNFFEKRVGDYQKASVAVTETPHLSTMDITDKDF